MQKITVVGYNRDEDAPVTEDELYDALSQVGLSDLDITVKELDDGNED